MESKLIKWCLNNRFVVIVAFACVIFWGIYALKNIAIDAIPDIGENQQIIFTDWQGRDAKTIEDQITYPLSTKLFGLPGLKTIRASSAFGFSMIYVVFEDYIDFYWSRTRILEKLAQVQVDLPPGVVPVLGPDATGLGQVFWYKLDAPQYDLGELRTIQDWYIKYQLSSVEGVSEVASIGGFVKQYQIDVNPNKLSVYNINIHDVFRAVRDSNIDVGANVIEQGGMEFTIRGVGFIKSPEDIGNIVIGGNKGTPITISSIGDVVMGSAFRRGALDDGGKEVVGGVVVVRYGENPLKIIKGVKKKIAEIQSGLPNGIKITSFYDRTELINKTLGTLKEALFLEMLVAVIVVFVFLRHFASSIIVSVSLPISVLIGFIVMYYLKIDSNIMSLSGIAIAIGSLTDMGIVLVENAHRHLTMYHNKKSRLNIIFDSAKEVGSAVVTSILTTIVPFLAVFAMVSQEGKLFKPLAYTKTLVLASSVFIALTLTPVLCYYILKRDFKEKKTMTWLPKYYSKILNWVLGHKKKFLVIPAAILIISLILSTGIGREFTPPFDEGTILFMPVVSPSVSLTEAVNIASTQDKIIKSFPEVESVVGKIGRAESALDPSPIEMFETIINLKNKKFWRKGITKEKLVKEMDDALKLPGVSNIWTQPIVNRIDMLSTGIRTPIGVKIFGSDINKLEGLAEEVKNILKDVRGAADLYAEKIVGKPYIEITPSRVAIARYGLLMQEVMDIVEKAIGGEGITKTIEGRERYSVRVRYSREFRDNIESIKKLLVPAGGGSYVPLSQIADINTVEGPAMISSENGMLRTYVLMNVRDRDLVGFVEEAKKIVDEKMKGKLPAGYSIEWAGQYKSQVRAKKTMSILVPLSLLICYLLIYMNFKSHKQTLTIFLAIPVALSGGILFLFFSGYNFSVAVWVGFIALFGLAVDDGVLMTTYLNQLFGDRKPKTVEEIRRTTLEAGLTRIRPAFMTGTTTIFALLPLFLMGGTGIEVVRPMAVPSFGGMIMASITWFIVPCIYCAIKEKELRENVST